jgi:NhaP-type Na+/H+ or K+/H+ antiporter
MTFSLFVLGSAVPEAERMVNLAALVVITSVVVHGVTDTPGATWIGRREERTA